MLLVPETDGDLARNGRGRNRRAAELEGYRVLVVEDEFLIALEVEDAIRRAGGTVIGPVSTLENGLDTAEHGTFDVAVVDMNLRGEVATPIAETLAQRRIPFVAATGYDIARIAPELDCPRHLRKPYRSDELIHTLVAALADERA